MATKFVAIVTFPGSNCEQDAFAAFQHLGARPQYVWHKDDSLVGFDLVVLPGGFSYGDYLRCGAIARYSPIMAAVEEFANNGGAVLGICNGFQILCESHLLPGALLQNRDIKFLCQDTNVQVQESISPLLSGIVGQHLVIPINHNEGNYFCSDDELASLLSNQQIVLRYTDETGKSTGEVAPNGAKYNIAGICNEAGNVIGLMPHPERCVDGLLHPNYSDGAIFLRSILDAI